MMMGSSIGVVIVGYNSKRHLKACFDSIYASDYTNFQIFFVDNNSSDQSAEFVEQQYPQATLIRNPSNLGFARATNIGIAAALKQKLSYIFLLNPDTVIDKDCLGELSKVLNENTIVQPMVLLYERGKTNLVNTAGNDLNFLGISYCGDYRKNRASITKTDIVSSSGAAMVIPARVCKKIGLFAESFFMYHEDLEYSWRARMAGYSIQLAPRALVWHKYQFSANKNKFILFERNRLLFLLRSLQLHTLLLIVPAVLIHEILTLVYALKNGWFLAKLRSYWLIVGQIPAILKTRATVVRVRNDRQLKRYISSDVDFAEVSVPLLKPYNLFLRAYWSLIYPLI